MFSRWAAGALRACSSCRSRADWIRRHGAQRELRMKPVRDKHDRRKDAIKEHALGPNEGLIGKPRSRERLATPALVLDLDALEHNLSVMADACRKARLSLRP